MKRIFAFAVALLAAPIALAQNPQGLIGHYEFISMELVSYTPALPQTRLSVASSYSAGNTRTFGLNLALESTGPLAWGEYLDGSGQNQVSVKVYVEWIPGATNPANLKPQGQSGEWSGSGSSTAEIFGAIDLMNPTVRGTFMGLMSYNPVDPFINENFFFPNLSMTPKSQTWGPTVEGGFEFLQDSLGRWVGGGGFQQTIMLSFDISGTNPSNEFAGGKISMSLSKTLSKIGGLEVRDDVPNQTPPVF